MFFISLERCRRPSLQLLLVSGHLSLRHTGPSSLFPKCTIPSLP